MTDQALHADVPTAVDRDRPCRQCGYNLRGLHAAGLCPECATPVPLSLRGDLLRDAHPGWLRTLYVGAWLLVASQVVNVLRSIAFPVLASVIDIDLFVTVATSTSLVYLPLHLTAVWLLTTPGSADRGAPLRFPRLTARVGLLLGLGSWLPTLTHGQFGAQFLWLMEILSYAARAASIVAMLALLLYLSRLATWIPSPSLSRWSRHLMWPGGIASAATLAVPLYHSLRTVSGGPLPAWLVSISVMAGLVSLAFTVAFVALLLCLALRLRTELRAARASWAA